MFTGLVEETGTIRRLSTKSGGADIVVAATLARDLRRGESVSVNGACLTVAAADARTFRAEIVTQTLERTTLGSLRPGDRVNLERALAVGDRLGGHLVTGHVDGVGSVRSVLRDGDRGRLEVRIPGELVRHVVDRGSIAVDGTSLTVAAVSGECVSLALIPETLARTVAGGYRPGDAVNIETDVLAKYVESLGTRDGGGPSIADGERRSGLTLERLRELGFVK